MLYPVLTESRLLSDLSGVWDFKLDNEHGFEEEWYARPLEDKMTMPVPASYNDLKEGVSFRDHYGWVFYQRTISVPRFVREQQRVVLRCDAVTHHARVYLNGEEIIEHRGGFLPFEVEIGGLLKDGDNLLTIAVDNVIDHTTLPVGGMAPWMSASSVTGDETVSRKKENYPNFDFFNYCGITRPVKIYTTPETYISDITLTADVEDPLADNVKASVNFRIDVAGTEAEQVCCKVEIFDRTGKKAGEGEGREGRILLENVTLWQPGNAYLYTVKVTAGEDVYELPYGIRTVKVEGTKFLINGRSFYFKGYGKHEDTFPAGRGMNIPMYVKDLSIMRWQGANSFRTSHYPYSEEMMQLADEEGFVIIDETPAVGVTFDTGGRVMVDGKKIGTFDKEHGIRTFEHHKEVIRDMILRDKNHASVVMWSIANEPDSYTEGAYEYFAPLFELARELDPEKRPCTLISVQTAGGPDTDVSAKLSDSCFGILVKALKNTCGICMNTCF